MPNINQFILMGRLANDPTLETKDSKEYLNLTLAVKRNFKNPNGEYDTDFITLNMWDKIAKNVSNYCQKGDLISASGYVKNNNYTNQDGKKIYKYEFIAEKVCFLHSKEKKDASS